MGHPHRATIDFVNLPGDDGYNRLNVLVEVYMWFNLSEITFEKRESGSCSQRRGMCEQYSIYHMRYSNLDGRQKVASSSTIRPKRHAHNSNGKVI